MRGDGTYRDPGLTQRVHGQKKDASFQVIILGASGGPLEDTVTGLLVRAPQSEWRKGSMIAVDAGTHLGSIVRILQQHMPLSSKEKPPTGYSKIISDGPFAGIKCPGYSAKANALHIFREIMHAFLITHPHLDHLAAMAINTPALEYGREAKTIVGLDSTIEAFKAHIFNDAIWPNLSDEGSGVGFVTYRRLKEGGNHRLGTGDARGYVRVCDSLATLCMGVSHGKCKSKPTLPPHHRSESSGWHDSFAFPAARRLSRISDHDSYFAAVQSHAHNPSVPSVQWNLPPGATTPGYSTLHTPSLGALEPDHMFEPVKSSSFFILNEETSQEILIFGDIEPDTVSISPLNYRIWKMAAPKVASGILKGIFIECSYDDSVRDSDLYGHLCPRHLIQELLFLAKEVAEDKAVKNRSNEEISELPMEHKREVTAASPADATRKRKKLNGTVHSLSGLDQVALPPAEALIPSDVTNPFIGTRSSSSNKRKTSLSTSTLPGDISPISLRGASTSRISHPRHVHFSGSDDVPSTVLPQTSALAPSLNIKMPNYSGAAADENAIMNTPLIDTAGTNYSERKPDSLKGLVVHIIHIKATLTDGPGPGDFILAQLEAAGKESGLECEFDITEPGESIWI